MLKYLLIHSIYIQLKVVLNISLIVILVQVHHNVINAMPAIV